MINKIKSNLNSWMENRLSKLGKRQRSLNVKNFHFAQLSGLFNDQSHFIPLTVYSISPSTIVHIINDININNRKVIVEFGTGSSTIYIAKFLEIYKKNVQFLSIESNKDWYYKLKDQLISLELLDRVNLIYAPLVQVPDNFKNNKEDLWYDTAILKQHLDDINSVDLTLIDGPDGDIKPYIRSWAIPFLNDYLADSYSIFLDDANRENEYQIARTWQGQLDCELKFIDHYAYFYKRSQFLSNPYSLG